MRGRQKAIDTWLPNPSEQQRTANTFPAHSLAHGVYQTYHMCLGTFIDVMRGDYHSCVTIFRYIHQMIPNAASKR